MVMRIVRRKKGIPKKLLTNPVIKNIAFLWIPYVFTGVAIPLAADIIFSKCIKIYAKKKEA